MNINNCLTITENYPLMIELENNKLNSNINQEILFEAKKKIIGKCKENIGYIYDVLNVKKIVNNYIDSESLKCNIVCEVLLDIKKFNPPLKKNIVLKFDNYFQDDMIFRNGPLVVVINYDDINNNVFEIKNGVIYYSKENELKIGDYVIAKILNLLIKDNVDTIVGMGFLENKLDDDNLIKEYYVN